MSNALHGLRRTPHGPQRSAAFLLALLKRRGPTVGAAPRRRGDRVVETRLFRLAGPRARRSPILVGKAS
jgi:hypothetical protein